MNINQKVSRFPLCLGALVAIFSGLSGLGYQTLKTKYKTHGSEACIRILIGEYKK
jgi:hypothetical protein